MLKEIKAPEDTGLFEALADAMPALVWISDRTKACVWFNKNWLAFRGRPQESELGNGWMDGVHPEDLPRCLQIYTDHFDRREPFEMKYRLLNAAGQYRWIIDRAAPRHDNAGEFNGFLGACVDVHDAEMSDVELTRFFNIASDLLLTSDTNGYIARINSACEAILGWTQAEISAVPFKSFLHPEDVERTLATEKTLRAGEELSAFENRYRHKDGTYRWLSWRARLDPLTGLIYARAVDVTRSKAIEAELRQNLERFDLAMKATSEGVWDWNIKEETLYFSPRFAEMLGYAPDEIPQSAAALRQRLHPDDAERTLLSVEAYIRGDTPEYKTVFRLQHKNGAWRTILSRGVARRDDNGIAYRMVGIHADITDQQRLEDNLREAIEASNAASAAKSEFLANMSHELRTPMNAIVGASHIMRMSGPMTEKQTKVADVLKTSADAMMALIDQLLDIGRIETDKLRLVPLPFDARLLVDDAIGLVEGQAAAKGLSLTAMNACGCVNERLFVGDEARIRQILVCLCENAVKFTEIGGIEIEISCEPTGIEDVEELIFAIRDTGIGIPMAKLDSIFHKFQQIDGSLTRKYGGSGLGLAIARSFAELMGGVIHVESRVGEGSVFTLKLPLKRVERPSAGAVGGVVPSAALSAPCVLIVEDSPANVLVATYFLDEFGCRYEIAESGNEAVQLVKSGQAFDLIMMDIQMPGLDGRETTQIIRAYEAEAGLPKTYIIAVTAHSMTTDREKCLAVGMDDYISKPFDPELLRIKLETGLKARSEAG